jgi:tetratricopeptide (TPR) repeat protein
MVYLAYVLIALALIVIGVIVYKKIPQLRMIDVASIPKERARQVKEQLILQKFNRKGGAKLRSVSKSTSGAMRGVSKIGRRAVQRLYRMEQYYQKLKRNASEGQHAYNSDVMHRLMGEAETLIKAEEFIPAEKIFIDIISHNPKSADAYEGLGNLYIKSKQLEQARETLRFALKLAPTDASINASLGELEVAEGNDKVALEHFKQAVEKRSKNPRYLDYYIEAALKAGSLKDAREGIKALKEVNADNQKIGEFEARFQKKKEAYVSKTTKSTE